MRRLTILLTILMLQGCVIQQSTKFSCSVCSPETTMAIGAKLDKIRAAAFNNTVERRGGSGEFSVDFDAETNERGTSYVRSYREFRSK